MQTYDSYKDSGIDWLGEIPSHWEVKKLKNILSSKLKYGANESGIEYDEKLPRYIRITDFGYDGRLNEDKKLSLPFEIAKDYLLKDGDILFARSGATVGKAYQFKFNLRNEKFYCYAGYLIKAEPDSKIIFSDVLNYFTQSIAFENWKNLIFNKATIENIGADKYAELRVPIPPLHEQEAIARFLDDKCEKIDELVAIKEQQIDKLKELRQVKIHQAVTKGINPNVEMKDSGIDWIGEIPKHWDVKRFKFLCSINTGSKNTEDKVDDGLYPFYVRSQTAEKINTYSYDGEAILTAGDGAGVGKVYHYVNGKFDYHQRVYKFSDFNNVIGKYLYHFLYSEFYNVAILGTAKSTVDSLRLPLIQDFIVTFPNSKVEQEAIVAYLDQETNKIDQAIAQREAQIEKLKAYKQSLINEVVTGKVKVC